MATTATPPREVRISQIQPEIDWRKVWNNLHGIPTSVGAISAWYAVIHDLLSTNTRLRRISLVETETCTVRRKGHHSPRTHGTWGSRRNMGMDPNATGSDTWNRSKTHSPLDGYWGPVSAYGHVNDIWQHCGSLQTSYTIWCIAVDRCR